MLTRLRNVHGGQGGPWLRQDRTLRDAAVCVSSIRLPAADFNWSKSALRPAQESPRDVAGDDVLHPRRAGRRRDARGDAERLPFRRSSDVTVSPIPRGRPGRPLDGDLPFPGGEPSGGRPVHAVSREVLEDRTRFATRHWRPGRGLARNDTPRPRRRAAGEHRARKIPSIASVLRSRRPGSWRGNRRQLPRQDGVGREHGEEARSPSQSRGRRRPRGPAPVPVAERFRQAPSPGAPLDAPR
jgi:hypothetical protein